MSFWKEIKPHGLPSNREILSIDIPNTIMIIKNMPKDKWITPKPFSKFVTEDEMKRKTDIAMGSWIKFILTAQKGQRIVEKCIKEKTFSSDYISIKSFNLFNELENLPGDDFEEKTESLIRGFGTLLSNEAQERFGITDVQASTEDIENTKGFIANLMNRFNH